MSADCKIEIAEPFCWIIAYGNSFRGDDGAGPFVAQRLLDEVKETPFIRVLILHQLDTIFLEEVKATDHLIFVDACINQTKTDISWSRVLPKAQADSLTAHRLTPEVFVTLLNRLYDRHPAAWTVSIKGYDFAFKTELSPATRSSAETAARQIIFWLFTISIAILQKKISCGKTNTKERE